jgi:transposase InsO family protein
MAKYFPTTSKIDAPELAELFIDTILKDYGSPTSIITDRGFLFTSSYWSSFCYHMRIKRKLSTAFYSQTDGQTERQNQTLEHYLRCYYNYQQNDWAEWLTTAEFAYNNAVHASTKTTSFYALYGQHPRMPLYVEDDVSRREATATNAEN